MRRQTPFQGGVCKVFFSGVGPPSGHPRRGHADILPPADPGGVVVLRAGESGRVRAGGGDGR